MPEYIVQSANQEILPDGSEWGFVCENAREKESSNGNSMIELAHRIIGPDGEKKGLVYDNLVFTERAFWKIDSFRECIGEKLIPGQQVILDADDCIDRTGRLVVMVDVYQGRSKNKVDCYLPPRDSSLAASIPATVKLNELGEPADIPF